MIKQIIKGLITIVVCILFYACSWIPRDDHPSITYGSGNVVSEYRQVDDFRNLSLSVSGEVFIQQTDSEWLVVEADDNVIREIITTVEEDMLKIGFSPAITNLRPSKPLKFFISVITLNSIQVSGSEDVSIESLTVDQLHLDLRGSGDVHLDEINSPTFSLVHSGSGLLTTDSVRGQRIEILSNGSGGILWDSLFADSLTVQIYGSGDVQIAGEIIQQEGKLTGSGALLNGELCTQDSTVELSGSGDATIWATDSLDVRVFGSGRVGFYGSPTIQVRSSDLKMIKPLGERWRCEHD